MKRERRQSWGLLRSEGADRLVVAERRSEGITVSPAEESLVAAETSDKRRSVPPVVAFVSDRSARHERLELPPVQGKTLRQAIERAQSEAHRKSADTEACFAALRPEAPHDLMGVSVERQVVRDALAEIASAGYSVERLATPMSGLVGLLHACEALDAGDGAIVVVHIGEEIASVGFVFEGALLRARAFHTPRPEGEGDAREAGVPAIDPAYDERIIGEIGRSLLFFNHELQGKRVGRILLSSDLSGIEALLPTCRERFRVPVELTIDEIGLDTSAFRRCAGVDTTPTVWVSAIAAAVVGLTGRPDVDLRPRADRERSARKRLVAACASVFLLAAVVMSAVSASQLITLRKLTGELKGADSELQSINVALAELDSKRRVGRDANAQLAFLVSTDTPRAALDEALRALSLAGDGAVVLDELNLTPRIPRDTRSIAVATSDPAGSASPSAVSDRLIAVRGGRTDPRELAVTGRALGGNVAEAERSFEDFYGRLRGVPVFARATFRPIEIHTNELTGLATLSFEIRAPIDQ